MESATDTGLADRIVAFGRVLRRAGLEIGSDQVMDALKAVERVGVQRRSDVRQALYSVFVQKQAHAELFDQAFRLFWRAPSELSDLMKSMLPSTPGGPDEQPPQRVLQALEEPDEDDTPERRPPSEDELEVEVFAAYSASERLKQKDFADFTVDELAIARELADAHGVEVHYSDADMSKPDEVTGLIDAAVSAWGRIDIVVNNAGIQHTAPIESFPVEKWDAIQAIMLGSAFHTMRRAVPHMQEQGWGRIINTASAHGLVASPNKAAYVAAKHGLVGLTKVVALENADRGITCNAICPGWVETPLIRRQIEDIAERDGISIDAAKVELVRHKQPSRAFVQPEQIGAMAVYLCSDAASQITGTSLSIDGGWTAQ